MRRCRSLLIIFSLLAGGACAQDTLSATALPASIMARTVARNPTGYELNAVTIRAYEGSRRLMDVAAGISYIDSSRLIRYGNMSILSAVNSTPGIRMEERSPGSYRLSIRGSSLRSPFGVRNVKVYYDDIPFTDPGGFTYLNSLGFYNFGSVEIIKGPGSSVYGAGTGGVMLINTPSGAPGAFNQWATAAYTAGSNGLRHLMGEVGFGSDKVQHTIRYQDLEYGGYRDHSAMSRKVISYDISANPDDRDLIKAHFLYSDLHYETPGALTVSEYQQDPRAARPRVGAVPGSSEAAAAIDQKTVLAGVSWRHQFSDRFENKSVAYVSFVDLRNPTIRNYERSVLPHTGARTTFSYHIDLRSSRLEWIFGGEAQEGISSIRTYKTLSGTPDTLQTDDELNVAQYFGFTQLSWAYHNLSLTAGASINRQQWSYIRLSTPPAHEYRRQFDNGITPRFAALYKVTPSISIYASLARGFSPPASSELSPSGGALNTTLNAEKGWNFEWGTKGSAVSSRLQWNLSLFCFLLDNTITVRKDSANRDYYMNAGSVKQLGVEAFVSYDLFATAGSPFSANIWASYTGFDFTYRSFRVYEADYSGNRLPGAAPHTFSSGIDANTQMGFYARLTYFYSSKIALNDANTAYADSYQLLGLRLGYRKSLKGSCAVDLFAGADNLADQRYSLGNDINAFGGRYYNAAPGRNYYIGLQLQYGSKGRQQQ